MAYVAAGHLEAAKGSLQKALQDDPNFLYAANARDTLAKISKGSR
jgi:Tfp pilus assembly protein PilF